MGLVTEDDLEVAVEWIETEMILASDRLLETRYGQVELPVETLRRVADQINKGLSAMTLNHDPSRVLRIQDSQAYVEKKRDGGWVLKMRAKVHPDDLAEWQAQLKTAGVPGGMSLGLTTPIRISEDSGVSIIGDAADFQASELLSLANEAPEGLRPGVLHLFQFAADPEPIRLVIEFTLAFLAGIPANVVSAWLVKSLSLLRRKAGSLGRRPAWDIRYRRQPDGEIEFEGRFWVDDEDKATEALARVMEMIERQ